jgi:hypothetical protein
MKRLTIAQKQTIFDSKNASVAALAVEFGVSVQTICQHQKIRAQRKRRISIKADPAERNDKLLTLGKNPVGFSFQDIMDEHDNLKGHHITIVADIKPLDGLHYDLLRSKIQIIMNHFGR